MNDLGHPAAQGYDRNIAHIGLGERKVAVSADVRIGIDDPLAIGAKNADTVFFGPGQEVFFNGFALGTGFRKTARVNNDVLHLFDTAVFNCLGDELGRYHHVNHIDTIGNIHDGFIGLDAADFICLRVDRIDGALELKIYKIADNPVPDRELFGGGADYRHGFWSK